MFGFLLTLMILDGFLLVGVVLLQSGKGGGLAAVGGGAPMGTDSLIGGRQAATLLTRMSWGTGALFLILALTLSVLSSRSQQPSSILRNEFQQEQQQAPQPVLPGVTPDQGAQPQGAQPEGAQAPAGGATQPPAGTGTNPSTNPGGSQP